MSKQVKAFFDNLNWNQKVNMSMLAIGFILLTWKIGFFVALGFTCLFIYSRPDY